MRNPLRSFLSGVVVAMLGFSGALAHSGSHTSSHTSSHTGSHASSHSSSHTGSHTGPHSHPSSSTSHYPKTAYTASHGSHSTASSASRDSHHRTKRSKKAKDDFRHGHPCPSTGKTSGACPGYVIDHVQALKHGGADKASNMQWQTVDAAEAKDKWE